MKEASHKMGEVPKACAGEAQGLWEHTAALCWERAEKQSFRAEGRQCGDSQRPGLKRPDRAGVKGASRLFWLRPRPGIRKSGEHSAGGSQVWHNSGLSSNL